MGKLPSLYTDSEEDTSSSMEYTKKNKKKRKLSIFKYARCNFKKKKNRALSKSEPSESDFRCQSRNRSILKVTSNSKHKLVGILKHTERESSDDDDDDDDDDMTPQQTYRSQDRCLVGQVPRPPGTNPGRGGGVAILVRKNVCNLTGQQSSISSTKRRKKRLPRKRSF